MTNYAAIMLQWRPRRIQARSWVHEPDSWNHPTSLETGDDLSYTWTRQHSTERNRTTPTATTPTALMNQIYQENLARALYGTGKGNPQGLTGMLPASNLTKRVSGSTVPPHPVPPARPATPPGTPTP